MTFWSGRAVCPGVQVRRVPASLGNAHHRTQAKEWHADEVMPVVFVTNDNLLAPVRVPELLQVIAWALADRPGDSPPR